MPNVDAAIRARVEEFANEIVALTRESVMERVRESLGNGAPSRRGRPRGTAARSATRASRRPKGAKRSPAQLANLQQRLLGHIKANPGQRIEQIGAALHVPTKELALPAKKLLADKAIRTRGQKRATAYFPK